VIEHARKKIGYDCHVHLRPHVDTIKQPAHQLSPMATAARERGLILQVRERTGTRINPASTRTRPVAQSSLLRTERRLSVEYAPRRSRSFFKSV